MVVNSTEPEKKYSQYAINLEIRKEGSKKTQWPWKYVNIVFVELSATCELDNSDDFETKASSSHFIQKCTFSADDSAFYSSWDTSYTKGLNAYNKKSDLYSKVDTGKLMCYMQ